MNLYDIDYLIDEDALFIMGKTWEEVKKECEKAGYIVVLIKIQRRQDEGMD